MPETNDGKISTCKITDERIGSGSSNLDDWEGF